MLMVLWCYVEMLRYDVEVLRVGVEMLLCCYVVVLRYDVEVLRYDVEML